MPTSQPKKSAPSVITKNAAEQPAGFVYILECADGTLYCGSTNNLEKRIREHNESKNGAKYTKARRPVTLKYSEEVPTLSAARTREAEIKRMTRAGKLRLVK